MGVAGGELGADISVAPLSCIGRTSGTVPARRMMMAKGQVRSNKEARKPKKEKPKINAAAQSNKGSGKDSSR